MQQFLVINQFQLIAVSIYSPKRRLEAKDTDSEQKY